MKKLFLLVSVAIVFATSAIVFRSVRGLDRRLPKSDDSQLEKPAVLGEINFKEGFQNGAETNPPLTTVLLRDKPTLLELERLGRVPEGADERTWRLCESTSWWGNRLDPDSSMRKLPSCFISVIDATISHNHAGTIVPSNNAYPSQICMERMAVDPVHPLSSDAGRVLLFDSCIVGNGLGEIGVYSINAPAAITNGTFFSSVQFEMVSETSE